MEEKKTIFGYISQLFTTYGIMVLIFVVFDHLIGEATVGYSSLFALGREGLSLSTLLQLLLLAVLITLAQNIFLSDILIKNMAIVFRNICFFTTVLVSIIVMVVTFGWFPIYDSKAWIGFGLCYLISMGVSVFITRLEENAENKRMQKALEKYNGEAQKEG